MKQKFITFIICILIVLLAACSCGKKQNSGNINDNSTLSQTESENLGITDEDLLALINKNIEEPNLNNATTITLNNSKNTVSGNGATYKNGVTTITKAGTYLLSGTDTNGKIIVNAPKEDITIVLNNANITCPTGSPIYVYKAANVKIYLNKGTHNTLSDGTSYSFNDSYFSKTDDEPNACLYSKSDLIIYGSGSLTINANYNNGITSKDSLNITSANININSKNNGINGKDYCIINKATIKVNANGDAIRSTNDTDTSLGFVAIVDSTINLTALEDGIQAATNLTISGGSFAIETGGGSSANADTSISAKGLKAEKTLKILSGTLNLNCCDDAIHAENINILSGTINIATGDDGMHADDTLTISSGTINITKSYEGLEGQTVNILNGNIKIVSQDDGINAAGGADGSGFGGRKDTFASSSNNIIKISGGEIYINASGDGVDSNGNIEVTGGKTYVSGAANGSNWALDYDGTATITGGIFVAAGFSGMAQNFGGNSTQGSILLNCNSTSLSEIKVTDSQNNILLSYSPPKNYNCIVVSCPSLAVGNTYNITAGNKTTSVTLSSLIYGSGGMQGGGMPGGSMHGGGFKGGQGGMPPR